jgi:RNA polymerase sigma-70 factor (ECF subfamily)
VGPRRDEAVHQLYLEHYAQLAGWCNVALRDPETAHDIATEAFTRLLDRWVTVQDPRAWLYTTAANLMRDHFRRLERDRRYLPRLADPAGGEDRADHVAAAALRALIGELPDRQRAPVLLYYYADLTVKDIARILGRAEGSVKRALFDARRALRRALSRN